jgi:hypothetical protein
MPHGHMAICRFRDRVQLRSTDHAASSDLAETLIDQARYVQPDVRGPEYLRSSFGVVTFWTLVDQRRPSFGCERTCLDSNDRTVLYRTRDRSGVNLTTVASCHGTNVISKRIYNPSENSGIWLQTSLCCIDTSDKQSR